MFVLSLKPKLESKKTKVLVAVVAVLVCALLAFGCVTLFSYYPPETVYCEGYGEYSTLAATDAQVEAFVEQFYEVEELYSLQEAYVPIEFNEKYTRYNDLQKKQGFDLEPYKGEKCKLYMYSLSDFPMEDEKSYMSVMVYRERVIGADISTLVAGAGCYTINGEQVY